MRIPRLTIGRLMFAVGLLAVTLALLQMTMNGRSFLGIPTVAIMGLWPGLVGFGASSFRIIELRGKCSPFLRGFTIAGWIALLLFLAIARWQVWVLESVNLYYINEVDAWWIVWLIDSDTYEGYALSRLVFGLILATPQLMMAMLGGLIARYIWWKR